MRRAEPDKEALYIVKCLTMRDIAQCKSLAGKLKLDETLGMKKQN